MRLEFSYARHIMTNRRDSKVKLIRKYPYAGRYRSCKNSAPPSIENWKCIAKKKKFQMRLRPMVTGEML